MDCRGCSEAANHVGAEPLKRQGRQDAVGSKRLARIVGRRRLVHVSMMRWKQVVNGSIPVLEALTPTKSDHSCRAKIDKRRKMLTSHIYLERYCS